MMRVLPSLTALLVAAPLVAQQQAGRPVAPDAVVSIENENGSVSVTAWDRNEVLVRPRNSNTVEVSGDAQRVRVRALEDVALDVRVPRGVRLDVHTQTGSISVTDVTGTVELKSLSGSFHVTGDPRVVEIEGVSGSIRIEGKPERIFVGTVSGSINLPHATGTVHAETASGSIMVSGERLRNGDFSTASGEITFEGSAAADAVLRFDSASGIIELRLPSEFPATYELSTVSGALDNAFGPRARPDRYGGGTNLRFSVGDGGARVRASSVSGVVRIIKP